MSTLGGAPVLQIHSLAIPPAGGWLADVSLDATALPALASTTIVVGDLSLVGTVTSADFEDHPTGGARPRVTVEGGAGWNVLLARAGVYNVSSGVRLSTVLADLAKLAGEPYDAPADVLLGPIYQWPASTPREPVMARHVLAALVRRGAVPTWRVAENGRTRFDAWPTLGAADAFGRVLRRRLGPGPNRRTVGLDTRVAAFLPGSTLEDVPTRRLILRETAKKLEAEVYSQ